MQTNKAQFLSSSIRKETILNSFNIKSLPTSSKQHAEYNLVDQYGEFVARYIVDLQTGNFVSDESGAILFALKNSQLMDMPITEWTGGTEVLEDYIDTDKILLQTGISRTQMIQNNYPINPKDCNKMSEDKIQQNIKDKFSNAKPAKEILKTANIGDKILFVCGANGIVISKDEAEKYTDFTPDCIADNKAIYLKEYEQNKEWNMLAKGYLNQNCIIKQPEEFFCDFCNITYPINECAKTVDEKHSKIQICNNCYNEEHNL